MSEGAEIRPAAARIGHVPGEEGVWGFIFGDLLVFAVFSGGRVYGRDGAMAFGVLGPFDGKPATVGNGSMHAFRFDTREEVDAFHDKAVALGGTSEGLPGERGPGFYFSCSRDPEGNKLCAYHLGC